MEGGTHLHPSGVQSIRSAQCVSVIFHFIGIRKPAVSTYPGAVLMLETVIVLSLWAPTGWEPKTTEMGFLLVLEARGWRLGSHACVVGFWEDHVLAAHCVLTGESTRSPLSLLTRAVTPSWGPTLMTLRRNPNYLPKAPPSNAITLELGLPLMNFGAGENDTISPQQWRTKGFLLHRKKKLTRFIAFSGLFYKLL